MSCIMVIRVWVMSKLSMSSFSLFLCSLISFFHSSYGHPSIPVVERFLVRYIMDLTCSFFTGLFIMLNSLSWIICSLGMLWRKVFVVFSCIALLLVGIKPSFYRFSWWLWVILAILLDCLSICSGLDLGTFSLYIGSCSLFSLPSFDHIPPGFSPWCISFALRESFYMLVCTFSRCVCSLTR